MVPDTAADSMKSVNDWMPNADDANRVAQEHLPHLVGSIMEGVRTKDFNG
jgi:hypothetical protein